LLIFRASGQARTILGKALSSASKVVRYLATRHMGILLRAGVQDFSEWGIDYLVKQVNFGGKNCHSHFFLKLSDPDTKVTRSALAILDEACDEVENMDSLISKRPTVLLKLNQAGKDLWLRYIVTPK
jgi:rapamycin-insensitive companion of mTOR